MSLPPQSHQHASPSAPLWVKVCGLTTAEGIDAAVAADNTLDRRLYSMAEFF